MKPCRSITLIELLISIVFLSIIVLGLGNIDLFSRFHVISSDRRAKIDNEASLALGHMAKQIMNTFGNEISNGADTVVDLSNISNDSAIKVYVDLAADGISPGDTQRGTQGDRWIAYRFTDGHGNPNEQYQIWYCPNCENKPCANCTPNWGDASNIIARNISLFTPSKPTPQPSDPHYSDCPNCLSKSYITIEIQACWDPAETSYSCGTANNPSVTMKANMNMPTVSTN